MALSDDALAIAASNLTQTEIYVRSLGRDGKSKTEHAREVIAQSYAYWRQRLAEDDFIHPDSPP